MAEFGPTDGEEAEMAGDIPISGALRDCDEEEAELLDTLKIQGWLRDKRVRCANWTAVPRAYRCSIRRLHHLLGHRKKGILVEGLKGADADKVIVDAVAHFKCDSCECIAPPGKVSPVKAPLTLRVQLRSPTRLVRRSRR